MTIKKQLRSMVTTEDPVRRGEVSRITDRSIFVASPSGLKEFQVDSPSAYKVGDVVKFQKNTLLGRIPSSATSTTYVV